MVEADRIAVEYTRRVKGYELERLVGRGGVAEVYLARRESDRARFAVKILLGTSASHASRASIEGAVQQVLQHPNVVSVHEELVVDGAPALVMEYVDGPSLAEWLADDPPRTLAQSLELFRGIVRGVQAVHGAGLIHRDLKPANVLLATTPQGHLLPKITDFGLAKLTGIRGATIAGTAMGTPEYASPEQGRDASRVDQRADLYSLGCILYELLCGRSPFAGLDPYRMLSAKKSGRYRRVDEVVPDTPPELARIVDELLAYDPERRPADCEALLERLDAVHPPAPPAPASSRWLRLLPFVLLPLLAALLGALAVVGFGR